MSIDLRSLYAKVGMFRPDIKETALFGYTIQEAVREVCRRTGLLQAEVTATGSLAQGVYKLAIPATAGHQVLDVVRVRVKKTADTTWTELAMTSKDDVRVTSNETATSVYPSVVVQDQNYLYFYPATTQTTLDVKINYAYVPTAEMTTLDVSELATTAIENRAMSIVMMIPGPHQDKALAAESKREYHRALGNLKAFARFGNSGDTRMEIGY